MSRVPPACAGGSWTSQDFFQIELFQFSKPTARSLPEDWRPCDIGYSTIGIHVADFDATLSRLDRRRVRLLSDPIGEPGSRRVCVRDPDGVLLEVMEDDPRSGEPTVPPARGPGGDPVRHPVGARPGGSSTHLGGGAGPDRAPGVRLHGPEHEGLWGLPGATRQSFVLRAGDMFIEVVHYLDPVGRPWPDGYRISDHGLLNIALGLRYYDALVDLVAACESAGIPPNAPPPTTLKPVWSCSYVNDPMGFSIELLYLARPGEKRIVNPFNLIELGFRPTKAPVHRTQASEVVGAPPERVWQVLLDHVAMSTWSPFQQSEVVADPDGHGGVGTVRRLSGGPVGMSLTETIVVAEEPYRLEYTAEGAPGQRFYHGFITLEPLPGGGTRVTWEAQFHSRLPGVTAATTRVLRALVQGLARAAGRPIVEEVPA